MTRTFAYRDRDERTGKPLMHPVIATILHAWRRRGIHYAHVRLSRRIEHGVQFCITIVREPIQAKEGNDAS